MYIYIIEFIKFSWAENLLHKQNVLFNGVRRLVTNLEARLICKLVWIYNDEIFLILTILIQDVDNAVIQTVSLWASTGSDFPWLIACDS